MSATYRAKRAIRLALAAPGVRDALRWFLQHPRVPPHWQALVHRKVAKRARFGSDATFEYTTDDGVSLSLLHEGTANYLYWLGNYEIESTTLFRALARDATTILDIGAADGLYSLLAAAANPRARILAFEPATTAIETSSRNFAHNPELGRRIDLRSIALGDSDRQATLYVAGESGGTSSLDSAFRSQRSEQTVSVRTGDALLAELGVARIDLIKIDTESTEPAVLRGLENSLRRDHPDILCEVLHGRTEAALDAIVRELGYRAYHVTREGLVEKDRIVGDPTYREANYLFTRRDPSSLARLAYTSSKARIVFT
ncbi:MAG: FkbM family methyltransferase [Kofleriaceae bacterium]